jgi:hypothetical protein
MDVKNPKSVHPVIPQWAIELKTYGREFMAEILTRDSFDFPAIITWIVKELHSASEQGVFLLIRCLSPLLQDLSSLPDQFVQEYSLVPLLARFSVDFNVENTDLPLRALQLLLYLSPVSVRILLDDNVLEFFDCLWSRKGLPFGSQHILLGIAQKIIETPKHGVDSSYLLHESLLHVLALEPTFDGVKHIVLAALDLIDAFLRNEQLVLIEANLPEIMSFVTHYMEGDQFLPCSGAIFDILSDLYANGFCDLVHEVVPVDIFSRIIHNENFLIHLESFASLETQRIAAGQVVPSPEEVSFLLCRLTEATETDNCKATTRLLRTVAAATGLQLLFASDEGRLFVDSLRDEDLPPCGWCRVELNAIYWAGFITEQEWMIQMAFLNETVFTEELTALALDPEMITQLIPTILNLCNWEHPFISELTNETLSFLQEACASWRDLDVDAIYTVAEDLCNLDRLLMDLPSDK